MDDSTPDPGEHFAKPFDIEQTCCSIGTRRAQQQMIWLMFTQYIVDEIGRDRDLAAGLLRARIAARDQARDDGVVAESALHESRFRKPRLQVVAQHVLV